MRFTEQHLSTTALIAALLAPAPALACANAMSSTNQRITALFSAVAVLVVAGAVILFAARRLGATTRARALAMGLILPALAIGTFLTSFYSDRYRATRRDLPRHAVSRLVMAARLHVEDQREATPPVPVAKRAFPGGPGYTYNTQLGPGVGPDCAKVPPSLKPAPLWHQAHHAQLDAKTRAVVEQLRLDMLDMRELRAYQLTYQTGSGTGAAASATITLLANFKPETPECHTIIRTLRLDQKTGAVIVEPPVVLHELE